MINDNSKLFAFIRAFAMAANAETGTHDGKLVLAFEAELWASRFVNCVTGLFLVKAEVRAARAVIFEDVSFTEYEDYSHAQNVTDSTRLILDAMTAQQEPSIYDKVNEERRGLRVVESKATEKAIKDKFAILRVSARRDAVIKRTSTASASMGVECVAFYEMVTKPGSFRETHVLLEALREQDKD